MIAARFTPSTGGLAAATAYRDALDDYWGFARSPDVWDQHFADVVANLVAQASPLDPLAAWAVDLSCPYAPAGQDYDDETLYVYALDLLAEVPWPAGAIVFDLDMNSPEWTVPRVGP